MAISVIDSHRVYVMGESVYKPFPDICLHYKSGTRGGSVPAARFLVPVVETTVRAVGYSGWWGKSPG